MNLDQLRTAVRDQLDLDESDLTNPMLDLYVNEAVSQTAALEARWPFLGESWSVDSVAGVSSIDLPEDFGSFAAVIDSQGETLAYVGHEFAEANFTGETGSPTLFSVWGSKMYLWPQPTEVETFTIRGWRLPATLVAAGDIPDLDERLHAPLVHYACSRAYAQQEDEVLAQFYLQTWSAATEAIRRIVMRPRFQGQWARSGQPTRTRRRPWYRVVV